MVIGGNRQQTSKLSLRAGVWLERDRVIPGDRCKVATELIDQFKVSRRLIHGCVRMETCEPFPGDRHHLRRGVELHGARTEGDHRSVERQVTIGETPQVTKHLVLRLVKTEHRMGQVGALPLQIVG